jgi:hypothetical protein
MSISSVLTATAIKGLGAVHFQNDVVRKSIGSEIHGYSDHQSNNHALLPTKHHSYPAK